MQRQNLDVCIVGAGMSGLVMGLRLKQSGLDSFRIYEKAGSVGGTWRENRYPGLTCDVPSFFYSYSFEMNPDWSHRFSPGAEIQAYFERVAEKYELLPHIEFDQEITSARYRDGTWFIETKDGEAITADVFIMACGPLHQRKYPDIAGLNTFDGAMFHSADWNDDVALEDKRIGVIGTGSTAVQMMAPLSEVASRLTMFQRTAQWIMPVGNKRYSDGWKRRVRWLPLLAKLSRRHYQKLFEVFSNAVVIPGRRRRAIADRCRAHLASVEDSELRRKLTPNYEPMCKRLIMSRDFYPTLAKDHVELVTEGIERIECGGVRTSDGRLHELDILVLATGFDAHAWGVGEVVGERGVSLKQAWADGERAYRSVAFPGFPNFFMLLGPNSPIGNLSLIDVSEVQADYIVECLGVIRKGQAREIVPNAEATKAFHESLLDAMKDTVWVTGCDSWYLDEHGVPITWPWSAKRFHREMRRPDFTQFDLRV